MRTEQERARDRVLGLFVRERREQVGLTVNELAARAHVAPSAVSRLEHGTHMMRTVALQRLADALDVDLAVLLTQRGISVWQNPLRSLRACLRAFHLTDEAMTEAEEAIQRVIRKYHKELEDPD